MANNWVMAKNKTSFKKGECANPAGRPKGSQNRIKREVQQVIKEFVEDKADEIETWFDQLEPREKIQAFEKLLQYILPRKRENDIEVKVTEQERLIRKLFGDKKVEIETIEIEEE